MSNNEVEWRRRWLREFGKVNGYPGIVFCSEATGIKYAMGYQGVKEIWEMQVGGGNDDYINGAYEYLQPTRTGEEDLI